MRYQRIYVATAMTKKTAILIRCTSEEAQIIREAAANERRTLSGYILNAVMNRIRIRAQISVWFCSEMLACVTLPARTARPSLASMAWWSPSL